MEFNKSYEYLKQYIGKNLSIKELKKVINSTEQFDDRIFEGYNIVDYYILSTLYDFNSYLHDDEKVINIDITFTEKDHQKIQEMNYTNTEFENMTVYINNIYLYNI